MWLYYTKMCWIVNLNWMLYSWYMRSRMMQLTNSFIEAIKFAHQHHNCKSDPSLGHHLTLHLKLTWITHTNVGIWTQTSTFDNSCRINFSQDQASNQYCTSAKMLNLKTNRTRSTQRAQTSLAEADHYSHIAHCKNVEPWLWKTTHPPKKKKKKKKKGSGSLPSPRSGYATTITVYFCSFTHLTIPRSPPKFNQFFLVLLRTRP